LGALFLFVTGGVAVFTALFVAFAPYYSSQVWWQLRSGLFWIIPLLTVLALAFAAVVASDSGDSAVAGGLSLLAIGGLLGSICWFFAYNYNQDKVYAESIQVTTDPLPALESRVPFSISAVQVRSNLGEVPGDVTDTTYVPTAGEFTTLVERRGYFSGYQTLLEQQITEEGRNTPATCDFSPAAQRRLGGPLTHNLGRLINSERRFVSWENSDAYGVCVRAPDGTTSPKVVVPLLEQDGALVVTEAPAGVAVYDGRSGKLEIRADARGLPGPSYPISLAAVQRVSTHAMDGFWSYLTNRAGWELPDEADSVNTDNASEFVLATDGAGESRALYITPQTGRGAATAISVFTAIDAQLLSPALAPLVVHRLGTGDPVWLSPTAITDRIRATFGDVFAAQRDAGIYELAPLSGKEWVATIGTPQNMLYRVRGPGDLSTDPCLYDLDGSQIRCGAAAGVGLSGPGLALGPSSPGGTLSPGGTVAPAPAGSDLPALSDEQLLDLASRTQDELGRRLAG